jgi:hypothetical protein
VTTPNPKNTVSRLSREHQHAEFPQRLRTVELAQLGGVDPVLVDTFVSGCVEAWRAGGGHLDEERRVSLKGCVEDLDTLLPLLSGRMEIRYFTRLRELAALCAVPA